MTPHREYAPGEQFRCGLVILECVRTEGSCAGCFFNSLGCHGYTPVLGPCGRNHRTDGRNVIFKEVEQ